MWVSENFGIVRPEKEKKEKTIDPKKIMAKLSWKIRPDLASQDIDIRGDKHELSVRLTAAYEKANGGNVQELVNLHNEIFPNEDINAEDVEDPEYKAFEKEFEVREEIFKIIKSELEQLIELAKKNKKKSILNHTGLKQKWEQLCDERGLKYDSDYYGVRDGKYITEYLYHATRINI
ncbi:MAG TPA: hypothetical protein VF817_02385 [Patescibacteria group bacterium]